DFHVTGVQTCALPILLIKRILEISGASCILDLWPNLELYIHGGVSFKPYRSQFEQFIPSDRMHYLETYNASEGFFAAQDQLDQEIGRASGRDRVVASV